MKKLILATLFLFLATLVFADTHTMDVGATREDEASVTIGDGSQWGRVPMDFYYKNSLYQCLYYQAELGFTAREITALKLYSDFESFYLNGATEIGWAPHTCRTSPEDISLQISSPWYMLIACSFPVVGKITSISISRPPICIWTVIW